MTTIDAAQVSEKVRAIIAKQVRYQGVGLSDDTELAALGIESLDAIDIIFAIEEEFNIEIPYNANEPGGFKMATVGDAVGSVTEMLRAH